MKLKIAVDLDDVVFNFTETFLRFCNSRYGLDDRTYAITDWDWWLCPDIILTEAQFEEAYGLFTEIGMWETMPILLDALPGLHILGKTHEIIYFTARRGACRSDTVKALVENRLPIDGLIFCDSKEKAKIASAMGINIAVEDKTSTVKEYAELGFTTYFMHSYHNSQAWEGYLSNVVDNIRLVTSLNLVAIQEAGRCEDTTVNSESNLNLIVHGIS